ncbi:Uncharacterised protein [Neisseria meningitidis]|nr:Uncharacterised protein [Neisseria meningitidis]CWN57297.1 Uncharacterised protein [Neisseria meningitidis]CWR50477.1 Uncharacterised protein [Neisseria meningitidis]
MFLLVLVICNAAQDKAAVHAVAVAHIAFFGKGAQLFGKGGVVVFNILARHRTRDITELQIVAALVPAALFEDMHHPVVGRSCQIPADRHDGAVDDVAQITLAVVAVFADAVSLAVFWLAVVFFFVDCVKSTVIIESTNRPRQQHFAPLVGLRCDIPVLEDAESVVFAVIAINTRDPAAVPAQADLVHAARQSDDGLPSVETRLVAFDVLRIQSGEGIPAGPAGVGLSFQLLEEDAAARTAGVGRNRSGIHLHLTILHRAEPQRGGGQCRRRGFGFGIGVGGVGAAPGFDFRQAELDRNLPVIFNLPRNPKI